MAQTAVCNRHHTVEQQLCRWLLLSLDRLPSNELSMTQELIANMLGVRREGVTEAAGQPAKGRVDSIQPRPNHRAGSSEAGEAGVRVLRGGQEGVRPPASRQSGILSAKKIPPPFRAGGIGRVSGWVQRWTGTGTSTTVSVPFLPRSPCMPSARSHRCSRCSRYSLCSRLLRS